MSVVVSDTGPLIALAKVDQLHLLEHMFGEVLIPTAVYRELLAKPGVEAVYLDRALQDFLKVVLVSQISPEVDFVTSRLDRGEREAVALAYEHRAPLIIDERLGRLAARRLGLSVTGVVGVLIQAKSSGLLVTVCPVLETMRQRGYWLSDDILDLAARLSGEI
jgi:predicted nucleic acid-binding protein